MIPSCRTIFCAQPRDGWTTDHASEPNQKSSILTLHMEDVTHDAHNRLLFRLPKSLRLPSAHATSEDCGRAWRHGRLSSISYSRAHEHCRQPADHHRIRE